VTYTEIFLADLERELPATRRVLERIPDGRLDWKPAESSMPLRALAVMVASMPEWLGLVIQTEEFDIKPKNGKTFEPPPMQSASDFVRALDASAEKGRAALRGTNDEHLMKSWKMLSAGRLVQDSPRHVHIRDGVLSHWVHHRAQLAVYLRLLGAKVPAIYGPSADEEPAAR
jgi:uncharacterized damage-inducible protein DinB